MEKSNKLMLSAALVVALVALAGAGYAALSDYTAVTVNNGNSLQSEYIELTQSNNAAYTENLFAEDALFYDTLNYVAAEADSASTVYKLRADTDINASTFATSTGDDSGDEYVKVSEALDLTITPSEGNDVSSVKIDVTASHFTPIDGLKYCLILKGEHHTYGAFYSNGWNIPSVDISAETGDKTYAVSLYIGMESTSDGLVTVTDAEAGSYAGVYLEESDNLDTAGFNVSNTNDKDTVFAFVATPVTPVTPVEPTP